MKIFIAFIILITTIACGETEKTTIKMQNDEFHSWLDSIWEDKVNRYPVLQTEYGFRNADGEWDDISDKKKMEELTILTEQIEEAKERFEVKNLSGQALLSYKLFLYNSEMELAGGDYLYHNYSVNQMRGWHSKMPSVLINQHSIRNKEDAENYISRVEKVPNVIDQIIQNLKTREEKGVIAPDFILTHAINICENLTKGSPIENTGKTHDIYDDFTNKISEVEGIDESSRESLTKELSTALKENFAPAYDKLSAYLKELKKKADDKAGVWKLPNGDEYYKYRLKLMNTIEITPDEIFDYGMSEIERIHGEMKDIMEEVNYDGTMQEFFKYMRESEKFYFPSTEEGRQTYLDSAKSIIDRMKGEIDKLFNKRPRAKLIVKAVEPFREKTAGKAFYEAPSLDGDRPGIYYANLYDMKQMPSYQMEALAYHEGVPGHHMQIAISQELDGLPKYRTAGERYVAYVEGWGLYSEYLPKDIGYYKDPYSDFGRLAMELWRSCRLVVDVGIHDKKWDRQKAIDFYKENTPNAEGDCIKMVDRHIVMPGQATGYKIGMKKILDLRDKALKELERKFSIKLFHDVVLENGAIPLFILEEEMNEWIERRKRVNVDDVDAGEESILITPMP